MKTGIVIITTILFLAFLWVGNTEIKFNPFRISIPDWKISVGSLLWVISIVVLQVGNYERGYKTGLQKGSEITIETLKELAEENQNKEE